MHIKDEMLYEENGEQVEFEKSPHTAGRLEPRFIFIHYTEGQTVEGTIDWMLDPDSYCSSHFIVGKDGRVVQVVPLDKQALHTGPSSWKNFDGMAPHSIGVELDSPGPIVQVDGEWISLFGKKYGEEKAVKAPHKHGGAYTAWHPYPEAQIGKAVELCRALVQKYEIEEILGHDDISPKRKWDPGPAFPMGEFRKSVFKTEKEGEESVSN